MNGPSTLPTAQSANYAIDPNNANTLNPTSDPYAHLPPPPHGVPPLPPPPSTHAAPHASASAVPPTGPPPRYTRYMNKYAMRWPLIFSACVGFIWAVAMGVYAIRDFGEDGETGKEKTFDMIEAILYFVVAAIEAYCVVVAVLQRPGLGKTLKLAAPIGIAVAVGAQIVAIAAHFVTKGVRIDRCTTDTTGALQFDRFGNTDPVDADEARSLCEDAFDRGTWRVFAWLVVVGLLAIFFAGIALSYSHQLLAPPAPMSQSIPLQNYPPPPQNQQQGGYWGAPPSQQQSWMVPPYPGPPPGQETPYEKSDYHPDAEWAQAGYAPPSGPPGAGGSRSANDGAHREEEEAWERARSEGVTAHLTGHAPAPRRDSGERGYAIRNEEEDEAWERARGEGVTAHLTGHDRVRRDGDVV